MAVDGFGKRSRQICRCRFQDLADVAQRRRILVAQTVEQDPALAKAPRQESVVAMKAELNPSGIGLNSFEALDRYDFLDRCAKLFVQVRQNLAMHADDAAITASETACLPLGRIPSVQVGGRSGSTGRFSNGGAGCRRVRKTHPAPPRSARAGDAGPDSQRRRERSPGLQIVIVGKCKRSSVAGPGFAIVVGKTQ